MSDAPRMPLARAEAAAQLLVRKWQMNPHTSMIAGSIRRRVLEVGDIDLLAPVPPAGVKDALHDAIEATCIRPAGLFPDENQAFSEEISGLKPGFLSCHLRVQLQGVTAEDLPTIIPVQINRYTPENRGWQEIMRTGPREFGIWFLVQWKARFQIPQESKASIEGHLVDPGGRVIPVESEADAFQKCGIRFVPPEERGAFMARIDGTREREQRETLR